MGRKSRAAQLAERDRVLAVLKLVARPVTTADLVIAYKAHTGRAISYATLRVRLNELVASGHVHRSAKRRNTRFSIAQPAAAALLPSQPHAIPLSDQSKSDLALLQAPRAQRQPVAYAVEFLEAYEPGTTWYLNSTLRAQLQQAGRTASEGAPAGTYARDIMQRLVIDLSWGSSRLEGNRFTRIDTEELVTGGDAPAGASAVDRQMILNHKAAIEFLVEGASEIAFNRYTILNLHALLSENLVERAENEGALRVRPVAVSNSVFTPTAVPQVIVQCFDSILEKAERIPDPIEQSFFVMVHLPYLQPFIDVNKRTSRLAANIPLIRANLCPLSFVDVSEELYAFGILGVYELQSIDLLRDVFGWAYLRSCEQFRALRAAMGEPNPIRLNYRNALRAVVAEAVRGLRWPNADELMAQADAHGVAAHDRSAFAQAAISDLRALRADTLVRYALRPSEFEAWRTTTQQTSTT